MDSNPRKFILYVDAVGVELNNAAAGGDDAVEIIFRGNVTPGDRKRLQRAINKTVGVASHLNTKRVIPMAIKRLL